jgi:hypothetical protein
VQLAAATANSSSNPAHRANWVSTSDQCQHFKNTSKLKVSIVLLCCCAVLPVAGTECDAPACKSCIQNAVAAFANAVMHRSSSFHHCCKNIGSEMRLCRQLHRNFKMLELVCRFGYL